MNEIENIRKEIIRLEQLHMYDQIDYDKFSSIYKNSQELLLNKGITLNEREFADFILGITKASFKSMRLGNVRPKILKDLEVSEEEIKEVRKKLINDKKLHRKMMVSYAKIKAFFDDKAFFLPLREEEYYEKVLDISIFNLRNIKPTKKTKDKKTNRLVDKEKDKKEKVRKTSILEKEKVSSEEISKFRKEVMRKAKLHIGDGLTYSQLQEIFNKYYIRLSEDEFMQEILDISNKCYAEARCYREDDDSKEHKEKEVWILRNEPKPDNEFIKYMKKLIILTEKLHIRDKLTYEKIHNIFNQYYTPLPEVEFAEKMLEVSEASLRTIKSNGKEAVILKSLEIKDEWISKFRREVIKKEGLCINQKINYSQFLKIYNENYFPLSEIEYAEKILDISYNSYIDMRYNHKKRRILKDEKILPEEIQEIQDGILKEHKIGKWIKLNEFNEIYKKFPIRLLEKDYASQILHISKTTLKDMKSKGTRGRISFGEEEYETEVFKALSNNGYYLGYKLDLEEFKKIYNEYGNKATIETFAKILGIDYITIKRNVKQPILNTRIKKAKDQFKQEVKNAPIRFHDLEEMNQFCEKNNITFDEFLKYIQSIFFYDINELKQLIEAKKGCWYGGKKISCTNEFTEKYKEEIMSIGKSIARSLCRKYQVYKDIEEYTAEAILYIIEKCGDLERNYGESEEKLFTKVKQRTRLAIKGKIIIENFVVRKVSTTKYHLNSQDDLDIQDEKVNIESEVIDGIEEDSKSEDMDTEKIIKGILLEIEKGYDIDDILENISMKLNCNKNELMLLIKEYYMQNNRSSRKEEH